MTTLRERLARGEYKFVREYLLRHKNNFPMCCFETKTLSLPSNRKVILYRCSFLKEWYTLFSFRRECRKCVEDMKGILSEMSIRGEI